MALTFIEFIHRRGRWGKVERIYFAIRRGIHSEIQSRPAVKDANLENVLGIAAVSSNRGEDGKLGNADIAIRFLVLK